MTREKYMLLRGSGRCVKCEQPSPKRCCASCTAVAVETARLQREALRAAGLCTHCKGDNPTRFSMCPDCRAYINGQRRTRYAAELARPVRVYRPRAVDPAPHSLDHETAARAA